MTQTRQAQSFHSKARTLIETLAKEIRGVPDVFYLLVLAFFHLSLLAGNIRFILLDWFSGGIVKIGLSAIMLVCLGIYLVKIMVDLTGRMWLLVIAIAVILGALYLCTGIQRDKFDGLMIVLLIIGAYGKSYDKILKVLLWCTVGAVSVAILGMHIGLTVETPKVGAYGTGLAFGFAHPNVFGSYVFFIFVTIWYLYIRHRSRKLEQGYSVFSVVFAVFMVIVPKCRTQALLLFAFPFMVLLCRWATGEDDHLSLTEKHRSTGRQILLWLLIASPILCFLITVVLGFFREWLVVHTFGTYIENFSKRFIQAGLAFKEHGFPFFRRAFSVSE